MSVNVSLVVGGRNRKCSEAFVKTGKSIAELEKEMLNGQKLQVSLLKALDVVVLINFRLSGPNHR